jgi:hypothetical protein
MHSFDSESQLKRYVCSSADIIHELMDYGGLREISSISRIHGGSSTAIFSYNFKPYHPIELYKFVSGIHSYNTDHNRIGNRQTNRPNYLDKLSSLKFHSIRINYNGGLYPDLYNHQCLLTCSYLEIFRAERFYDLCKAWNFFKIKFAVNKLKISISNDSSNGEIVERMFSNVTNLELPNSAVYRTLKILPSHTLTISHYCSWINPAYFPASLESLTINQISSPRLDLSNVLCLKELIIEKGDRWGIDCINLPDSLERLQLPSGFLARGQKLSPNLGWFRSNEEIGFSRVDPRYFKNSSIKELYLTGFNNGWWEEFEPPSSIQSIGLDSFHRLRIVCKRMRTHLRYQLRYVIIGLESIDGCKEKFIKLWICSDKRGSPQVWEENENCEYIEWFAFKIKEFEEIDTNRIDWTDPVIIREFQFKF